MAATKFIVRFNEHVAG